MTKHTWHRYMVYVLEMLFCRFLKLHSFSFVKISLFFSWKAFLKSVVPKSRCSTWKIRGSWAATSSRCRWCRVWGNFGASDAPFMLFLTALKAGCFCKTASCARRCLHPWAIPCKNRRQVVEGGTVIKLPIVRAKFKFACAWFRKRLATVWFRAV